MLKAKAILRQGCFCSTLGTCLSMNNSEAIRILVYPQEAEKVQSLGTYLAQKIRSLIVNGRDLTCLTQARELVSGRRRYLCRIFDLATGWKNSRTPAMAVLIEREVSFQVSLIAERFQLTHREGETLSLLLGGLTSKEIAQRMQISPNTVKAFLRLVMIKMGVSSRPGIMGKIFKMQIAAHEARPTLCVSDLKRL